MFMNNELNRARVKFIEGMSRISAYWGFPKAMGAIYGAIYLSPTPISLDDLVEQVGISKGAVSTSVRNLERLGLVHKHFQLGDRKDYYIAEADFWRVVKSILKEREKNEFARALNTVEESLKIVSAANPEEEAELAAFYQKRMEAMKSFFDALDNLVATIITLDELRLGSIQRLFKKSGD
jgi:DNA-binding transcriptional regulator GbsR (MarR family)